MTQLLASACSALAKKSSVCFCCNISSANGHPSIFKDACSQLDIDRAESCKGWAAKDCF